MIQMVVRIAPPSVVSYPAIILGMNVRRFWMPWLILIGPSLLPLGLSLSLLSLLRGRSPYRWWPVLRNVSAANALLLSAALLWSIATLLWLVAALLPVSLFPLTSLPAFLCQHALCKTQCPHHWHHA
jgi:hypothetical protein